MRRFSARMGDGAPLSQMQLSESDGELAGVASWDENRLRLGTVRQAATGKDSHEVGQHEQRGRMSASRLRSLRDQ